MTIQERIAEFLMDKGMFPKDAIEVIERLKKEETVADFNGRWSDDIEGYPPFLLAVLFESARQVVLSYIDEKMPRAFFRNKFTR